MSMQPGIEVTGLNYTVDGRQILRDLNISVNRGEIIGLVGSSGSGKSTLIKCIAGLLGYDSGEVAIDGVRRRRINRDPLAEVDASIGFVFQYSALFDSMTVFENIALAPLRRLKYTRRQAEVLVREKLAAVNLPGVENYYPSQLSGGMAKRVGLARALAMEPRVLFYDEPTSGLDPPTARSIDQLIRDVRDRLGVTSIVVSHDIWGLARFVDRIALLEQGRIEVFEHPDQFLVSDHPSVRQFVLSGEEIVS